MFGRIVRFGGAVLWQIEIDVFFFETGFLLQLLADGAFLGGFYLDRSRTTRSARHCARGSPVANKTFQIRREFQSASAHIAKQIRQLQTKLPVFTNAPFNIRNFAVLFD